MSTKDNPNLSRPNLRVAIQSYLEAQRQLQALSLPGGHELDAAAVTKAFHKAKEALIQAALDYELPPPGDKATRLLAAVVDAMDDPLTANVSTEFAAALDQAATWLRELRTLALPSQHLWESGTLAGVNDPEHQWHGQVGRIEHRRDDPEGHVTLHFSGRYGEPGTWVQVRRDRLVNITRLGKETFQAWLGVSDKPITPSDPP